MHLDEDRLQRLLHGELAPAEDTAARVHVAACGECARRLQALEREEVEVGGLLGRLDGPAPQVGVEPILRRAGAARRARMPRWAAGVVLVLGLTGVAYALPGSPLPRLARAIADWASGRGPESPAKENRADSESSAAGIAVAPGQKLQIHFRSANAGGQVAVSLTSGTEVEIRAPRGPATYTSGEDQVIVNDRGLTTTYEIGIPLTAPMVEIWAGDRMLFLKEGTRVTTPGSQQGSARYVLPLNAPTP